MQHYMLFTVLHIVAAVLLSRPKTATLSRFGHVHRPFLSVTSRDRHLVGSGTHTDSRTDILSAQGVTISIIQDVPILCACPNRPKWQSRGVTVLLKTYHVCCLGDLTCIPPSRLHYSIFSQPPHTVLILHFLIIYALFVAYVAHFETLSQLPSYSLVEATLLIMASKSTESSDSLFEAAQKVPSRSITGDPSHWFIVNSRCIVRAFRNTYASIVKPYHLPIIQRTIFMNILHFLDITSDNPMLGFILQHWKKDMEYEIGPQRICFTP